MCGLFGVFDAPKAAELTVIGLHGIQHRAIDYAGIVSTDGTNLFREVRAGVVRQAFTGEMLNQLHGRAAIGHIRYPTVSDNPRLHNIQPIVGTYCGTPIAVAHNGNITNVDEIKEFLGIRRYATSMDTELILRLIEKSCTGTIEQDLSAVLSRLKGSFALVILTPDCLIAVRDPAGNRPLSIARNNGSHFVCSETCVFPNLDATQHVDVEPGTMVLIRKGSINTVRFAEAALKNCPFEPIYFAHPSSTVFDINVSRFRMDIGRELERLFPVGADIITPVPDSSTYIAMGYGESGRSGIFMPVIVRSHYVGRTFIAATQAQRDTEVAQKFAFTASEIRGKRLVVIDDSIVRGTTLLKIIKMLKQLDAREIHVRIGCPPIRHPCTYGINTRSREELVSASQTAEEIRDMVKADSLEFLPLDSLKRLLPQGSNSCFACMDGTYW